MSIDGIPAGGFKTLGQIVGTNDLRFRPEQNAMEVASDLLSAHTTGAPVVNENGVFIGFISEVDLLRALETGKDLNNLTAAEVMTTCPVAAHDYTPIADAVKFMEQYGLLILPVQKNGVVSYSVTRHDLLRAWAGIGLGVES
ncbi:MAG TPA: CBS domain-containing protein [Nitrospiraceae bacterium]|nr:CBS domain-containing protein [Nitrospiraceae bacterium]